MPIPSEVLRSLGTFIWKTILRRKAIITLFRALAFWSNLRERDPLILGRCCFALYDPHIHPWHIRRPQKRPQFDLGQDSPVQGWLVHVVEGSLNHWLCKLGSG
jgi:hypothetical protein